VTGPPPFPSSSAAPPVRDRQRRSRWSAAIGIVSIVLGGLGLVCCAPVRAGGFETEGPDGTVQTTQTAPADEGMQDVFADTPAWAGACWTAARFTRIGVSALLVAAGIQLLRRRFSGWWLHLLYVLAAACAAALSGAAILGMSSTATKAEAADIDDLVIRHVVAAGAAIGIVFACILPLLYPVFILVWMLHGCIVREARSWRTSRPLPGEGP
jgi:hypothetical protein